jgi:hypothetical protein
VPLTPAHPAVVLPIQRLGLPLSALVVGAVAPDAPVYLPVGVGYATTHSAPGLLADVVIGLVLLWLWFTLLRDAVVDLTPFLRDVVPARGRPGRRDWLLAPVAVAAGAATHVLWDSATHDWGFLVEDVAFLRDAYGPMPLYRWLQHASTVVGGGVVATYCISRLRAQPAVSRPPAVRRPGLWLAVVPAVALVVGVLSRSPEAAAGSGFVALAVVAAGWRAVAR